MATHPRPTPYVTHPETHEFTALRSRLGLSRSAYARLLGLTYGHVFNIDTGRRPVSARVLATVRLLAARADQTTPAQPLPWLPAELDPAQLAAPPVETSRPGLASRGIDVTPGTRCNWASERCRAPWWRFRARLDAHHHLEGECCGAHLEMLSTQLIAKLRDARRKRQASRRPEVAHA